MVVIPVAAPSSVHGEYGYIRYYVRMKYDRPWAFDDEFVEDFTVVCPIDLNLNSFLRNPAEESATDKIECCSCDPKRVNFEISIPKTGFVPGEMVDLIAHVDNPTSTRNFL
jgi:hypothetical protein